MPDSGSTTFDASSTLRGLLGPLAPACQITAVALAPLTAPLEVLEPVVSVVEGTVGTLPVGAPQQPAPEAPAAAPAAPVSQPQAAAAPAPAPLHGPMLPQFTPYALGNFHSSLPLYNYAQLLVGRPGTIGRLQTGMLNSDLFGTSTPGGSSLTAQDPAANDVAAAGRASALPATSTERIALPVLVAVLMLAAVSAALIRSWVVVTRR